MKLLNLQKVLQLWQVLRLVHMVFGLESNGERLS